MRHGTRTGYEHHGCRCDRCARAARDYHYRQRRRRAARIDGADVPHGVASTYTNWMCRCALCVEAQRQKNAERGQAVST